MIGIAIIVFMIVLAIFAPLITPESPYNMFSFDATNQRPLAALHAGLVVHLRAPIPTGTPSCRRSSGAPASRCSSASSRPSAPR